MKKNKQYIIKALIITLLIVYSLNKEKIDNYLFSYAYESYDVLEIPDYNGEDYIYINNNNPYFEEELKNKDSFITFSELDELKRAGVVFANIDKSMLPTTKRESIGMVKPSGWQISKYDHIKDKYLYNRCHLIAFSLSGENANPKNLITCTQHMNQDVMTSFELKVLNYIKKTNHHVLYRVTPIYDGANLLAKGVMIEAESIEDDQIKFNVFIYNVQDGVSINYQDGTNKLIDE